MKKLWMILGIACLCTGLFAETQEEKLARLEKKIDQLEKAVQPLLAQQKKQEITQEQQKEARKRMGKDSGNYSREQLREIEQMYQAWRKVPETERSTGRQISEVEPGRLRVAVRRPLGRTRQNANRGPEAGNRRIRRLPLWRWCSGRSLCPFRAWQTPGERR